MRIPNIDNLVKDPYFEKIIIIFLILTDKYSYVKIDNIEMEVKLIDKSFFIDINLMTILETFIFDA